MSTIVNPYLPFWETVPDAEPRVFDGRLYIFGSHDRLGGNGYCLEDYVGWSAPVEDLSEWRCEGILYQKEQDPVNGAKYSGVLPKLQPDANGIKKHCLFAPDVVKGPDGRYYLYYALDYINIISVAVSDTPTGKYEFLDYVRYEDGTLRRNARYFDPAVLSEASGTYLYYGFCPEKRFPGMESTPYPGAMMVKLANDMHTIITEPVLVSNGIETCEHTSFEGHPFFEAPSIRHYGEWYYFTYSSIWQHELCYSMAKSPEGPFAYKGVLVSNADLGYKHNSIPQNYYANNHGGMAKLGDKFYIFWHRHTRGHQFSRQGCADKIQLLKDGTFAQTEITSCGLNQGPLPATQTYLAQIACQLTGSNMKETGQLPVEFPQMPKIERPYDMPYITTEEENNNNQKLRSYICNMHPTSVAAVKYLNFTGTEKSVRLLLRGTGVMQIQTEQHLVIAETTVDNDSWSNCYGNLIQIIGIQKIIFTVKIGCIDFSEFEFLSSETLLN